MGFLTNVLEIYPCDYAYCFLAKQEQFGKK